MIHAQLMTAIRLGLALIVSFRGTLHPSGDKMRGHMHQRQCQEWACSDVPLL